MRTRRSLKVIFAMILMTISILAVCSTAMAKTKIRLNKKQVTLTVGQQTRLVLKGAKKPRWSSSNKAVAKVNKRGVVTALGSGDTVITAKYKGKKYKARVTVQSAEASYEPVAPSSPSPVSANEFINASYSFLDNIVSIKPYHVFYQDGSLYADCYVLNGLYKTAYNINVKRFALYNETGKIAEKAFGVNSDGKSIGPRSYAAYRFVFGPDYCVQNAQLSGTLQYESNVSCNY